MAHVAHHMAYIDVVALLILARLHDDEDLALIALISIFSPSQTLFYVRKHPSQHSDHLMARLCSTVNPTATVAHLPMSRLSILLANNI